MNNTLLCWNSVRAGDEVLIQAIQSFKNRRISIDEVLLIEQEGHIFSISGLGDVQLKKISVQLEDPTRHTDIYNIVVHKVLPEIDPSSSLHINVSPGTPAMHAVWLILHAGGRLPENAKLWSSQFNPGTKRRSINPVDFPINTYLSEIRKVSPGEAHLAKYDFEPRSNKRKEAFEALKRFAEIPGIPLLVLGERGTGKTRLVETVLDTLKQKEIVVVPCGALDSQLAESQLFGHVKGAFTGAEQERGGLLKAADGGILFLDEIQDLPKDIQRKLVRVLQDNKRRFRPVGADEELSVDFELICASNKDLIELQEALDEDFFDRISMATVKIPALRECLDDLEHDWQQVWREMCSGFRRSSDAPMSESLMDLLRSDSLYGNLRDLQTLAVHIMAWWSEQDLEKTVADAGREWKKHCSQRHSQKNFKKNLSRKEHLAKCKHELAVWAKQEYLTWENAAKALGCTEKTLRTDAGLK
ncbi:Sigma-54 interaction domain-containing protein [Maridesulfovibrio ferrireducens]|uniref:Sigma-54 interaction domain-containing protein n=1 Tax=Maridesulfovibrio ferrireducens TaxID=246191 RepID=A0A1G9LRP5_9BACT|nr:sigma 54-interacting transcriptional regulator [Maridesulfovibrio ferrireducens]SDL64639.1 Sigma-54 interaction domain-containing protein [Maridesulfovibrio ferrireducens]